MPRADILRSVEMLTHSARVQQMIGLGRQARQDEEVGATLAAMERGDVYERYLALHS